RWSAIPEPAHRRPRGRRTGRTWRSGAGTTALPPPRRAPALRPRARGCAAPDTRVLPTAAPARRGNAGPPPPIPGAAQSALSPLPRAPTAGPPPGPALELRSGPGRGRSAPRTIAPPSVARAPPAPGTRPAAPQPRASGAAAESAPALG